MFQLRKGWKLDEKKKDKIRELTKELDLNYDMLTSLVEILEEKGA